MLLLVVCLGMVLMMMVVIMVPFVEVSPTRTYTAADESARTAAHETSDGSAGSCATNDRRIPLQPVLSLAPGSNRLIIIIRPGTLETGCLRNVGVRLNGLLDHSSHWRGWVTGP